MDDLVLRFSDQVEECLGVDWGTVFAEDEGRGGAGDAELVGVYWVVVGTFCGMGCHWLVFFGWGGGKGSLEGFGLTLMPGRIGCSCCCCFGDVMQTSC